MTSPAQTHPNTATELKSGAALDSTGAPLDIWNGVGNWTADPDDWSAKSPPSAGDEAEIASGVDTLSSKTSVGSAAIAPGAQLSLVQAGSLTSTSLLNLGALTADFGNGELSAATTVTAAGLDNAGAVDLDVHGGGGGGFTIGGVLTNTGSVTIGDHGNGGLDASTTATASELNNTGSIDLYGNNGGDTTAQANLDITGAAPSSVIAGASLVLQGDADLEFGRGGITSIAAGGHLELDGALARISVGAGATNSALSNLYFNAGVLEMNGDSTFYGISIGAGGSSVTTTTNLSNSGALDIDTSGGGGSSLTIGGILTNTGSVTIGDHGNGGLGASTTVTATGLNNTGSIGLYGNNGSDATDQATLDITRFGPSSSVAAGASLVLQGDADLEFGGGGITSIAADGHLELDGALARISVGAGATNSALSNLSRNAGVLEMNGDTTFYGISIGAGGSSVTTTTSLANSGALDMDTSGGGGSSLSIGGVLTNTGSLTIGNHGNGGLGASTTVTATGLNNTGSIGLYGSTGSDTTDQATLDITGTAPSSVTAGASLVLQGDADLEFGSGGITSIAGDGHLELDGAQARISVGAGATNSALSDLYRNAGVLVMNGNSSFYGISIGAGGSSVSTSTSFANSGALDVDTFGGGGSSLSIGGVLTNTGSVTIGNGDLSAATTVTAAGLKNSGRLDLNGDGGHVAGLTVSGAATNTGALSIGGGGELDVGGGKTFLQAAGTSTIGGSLIASTIDVEGGLMDFTTALTSGDGVGALDIFSVGDLEFTAAVDASHVVTFEQSSGTLDLGAPASFAGTIARFSRNDVIDLLKTSVTSLSYEGNSSSGVLTVSGVGGVLATLAFSGDYTTANFTAVSDGNGGTDILSANAPLDIWNGVGTWTGEPADWSAGKPPPSGDEAEIESGVDSLSSATSINSAIVAPGATLNLVQTGSLTTKRLLNLGDLTSDIGGGDGGAGLTIDGVLTNAGAITIGNSTLSASTAVTTTELDNTGSVALWGSETLGSAEQATLDITGAAPTTLTGTVDLHGDADLEFGSGGIASIADGASFQLDGAQSRASIGASATNSALSGLSSNAGTLDLEGDWSTGPGGTSVTTTTGLDNSGTLDLDVYSGDGASSLTIGGALTDAGSVTIGNDTLSASSTVTASTLDLDNTGSVKLWGNQTLGTTDQATLDVTGAAPSTVTGSIILYNDADLEFGSGGITSIAAGGYLEQDGAQARISIGPGATSTALGKLSSNAGSLRLLSNNGAYGAGDTSVTTTTSFANSGALQLDIYGGEGGSDLTIGGVLTNSGTATIGNSNLGASTTVTATGLNNTGSITLWGADTLGATHQATLDITGAAPRAVIGSLILYNDADLEFGSGGITSIAASGYLEQDGAQARVSIGAATSSTALTKLSSNAGTLRLLSDNGAYGVGGAVLTTTTSFANSGALQVDIYGGEGGTAVTLGGEFTNSGTATIGNTGLSAATTVGATGLNNTGTLNLSGSSGSLAELSLTGAATNSGALDVGGGAALQVGGAVTNSGTLGVAAGGELQVGAGHSFIQAAGASTIAGALVASTIDVEGGVLDITGAITSGDGVGALDIFSVGTLDLGAAVDASHTATFEASSGTLELAAPASFAGVIAGFSGNDVINLLKTTVTSLSYSGNAASGVLTLSNAGEVVASLDFDGDYTTANFLAVSDGNGGTDILDPSTSRPQAAAAATSVHAFIAAMSSFGADSGASQSVPTGEPGRQAATMLASPHGALAS